MARLKELEGKIVALRRCMPRSATKAEIISEAMAKVSDAICPAGDGDQGLLAHYAISIVCFARQFQGERGLLPLSARAG